MSTTIERLTTILVKQNKLAAEDLTPNATLAELKIDSLSLIELFFHIEDEFKVTLPSEDVKVLTLGDVVHYIDHLVAAQHGAVQISAPPSLPPSAAPVP